MSEKLKPIGQFTIDSSNPIPFEHPGNGFTYLNNSAKEQKITVKSKIGSFTSDAAIDTGQINNLTVTIENRAQAIGAIKQVINKARTAFIQCRSFLRSQNITDKNFDVLAKRFADIEAMKIDDLSNQDLDKVIASLQRAAAAFKTN